MFITFEGIEGSGKSTQIKRLAAWLEAKGGAVKLTREPGGSELGLALRRILLDAANTDIVSRAELFLYLADRAQHVKQVVQPALEQGKVVLCDRFTDSTVAYQGYGRGLDPQMLHSLNEASVDGVSPDLTVLFDLPPEVGLVRARSRNEEQGASETEGRFEAEELAFHHRVRDGYLKLAERFPERIKIVDATGDEGAVFDAVCDLTSYL
jgi:dTMP kinase